MTLSFSPVGDFAAVVDGLEEVTYTPRDGAAQENVTALIQPVTDKEVTRSNGKYRAQDVRIHLVNADVTGSPVPGDTITDGASNEYTVLTSSLETMTDRWNCVCRNLVITEDLTTLIKIQVATITKGDSGAHEQTWADLHTDVRGKITRVSATSEDQEGSRTMERSYLLNMREQLDLRNTHRIVGPDDVIYRVTGYRDPEAVDVLCTYTLEVWQ